MDQPRKAAVEGSLSHTALSSFPESCPTRRYLDSNSSQTGVIYIIETYPLTRESTFQITGHSFHLVQTARGNVLTVETHYRAQQPAGDRRQRETDLPPPASFEQNSAQVAFRIGNLGRPCPARFGGFVNSSHSNAAIEPNKSTS